MELKGKMKCVARLAVLASVICGLVIFTVAYIMFGSDGLAGAVLGLFSGLITLGAATILEEVAKPDRAPDGEDNA